MSKYAEIIYPPDENNKYPDKLAEYLYNRFMKSYESERYNPKILDIGCSRGNALKNFAKFGDLELYGIDRREEESEGFIFKECDLEVEKIPFPDDSFDIIYNKSVLEHVFNTENFLTESLRVLKPGGIFIGLTPDWAAQSQIFWDDFTHVRPFTKKGLRDGLNIIGFENGECEYFYQLPFTWKYPNLKFIPKLIATITTDSMKWKTKEHRNTRDRKLIRFSKEIMLLSYATKPQI